MSHETEIQLDTAVSAAREMLRKAQDALDRIPQADVQIAAAHLSLAIEIIGA